MITYSPKYGIRCQCLSVHGPCEKVCEACISSAEWSFETECKRKIAESKRDLEFLGYKVTLEKPRFEFLKD